MDILCGGLYARTRTKAGFPADASGGLAGERMIPAVIRPQTRGAALAALLALWAFGCRGSEKATPAEKPGDLGTQVGDAGADTKTMAEANEAAGTVIRAGGDCDAVKAALPNTNAKLDDVEKRIRTATARTTLESLRTQVRRFAEACP